MSQRIDTIEKYFEPAKVSNRIDFWLFWLSVVISFVVLFLENTGAKDLLNIVFIVVVVLYFLNNLVFSLKLVTNAENKRRIGLLNDAFGVRLNDEITRGYYNNDEPPSVYRLGVNVFENSLFTKVVLSRILPQERVKSIIFVIILIVALTIRDTELEVIAVIAQTLFTTSLLVNWIKTEIYYKNCEEIFEVFRAIYYQNPEKTTLLITSKIIQNVIRYECLKASMSIVLPSKVFHKINHAVSQEWETVKMNVWS